MKTFKQFLDESSLSRIKSKSDKSGIATLSADRGNKSRKENQARSQQLQKDIRGKFGRGPKSIRGINYARMGRTACHIYASHTWWK